MVLRERLGATIAGFLGAAVVLGALLFVVGVDEVIAALQRARPAVVVWLPLLAMVWLLFWGLALRAVLSILGIEMSVRNAFLVFVAATFANNVTPFGQAGGEPFSALLISEVADTEYETSLAAIASVDTLNFVPSMGLATLGLWYFATTVTLGDRLEVAAVSIAALAVVFVAGLYLGWQNRYRLENAASRVVTPVVRAVARVLRRSPPTRESIEGRIEGFFYTIERIAGDPRGLLAALVLSTLGWVTLTTCLWLALYSLDTSVVFAAAMIAVPVGALASVTPLPGGLGGVEAALVAILAPTAGLSLQTIGAAVVIHRAATYWWPMLVGAGAASALGVSARR